MNKVVKKRWVSALRSGDYKQGHDSLYDPESGTHCVLGVLIDVLGEFPISRSEIASFRYDIGDVLPESILKKAGLNNTCPFVCVESGSRMTLSYLNDIGRYTFEKLADLIEAQL